ncbi:hypothetical protein ACIA59_11495 [Micromonospora haikouensis]|uniref:hypothetical protein n=1 Tax=Micromonospora haikouensis TaxID=686309 RepID=UPI0037B04F21
MNGIRFSTDQYRLPTFEVDDQRLRVLGAWLITDVPKHLLVCLDARAMVAVGPAAPVPGSPLLIRRRSRGQPGDHPCPKSGTVHL